MRVIVSCLLSLSPSEITLLPYLSSRDYKPLTIKGYLPAVRSLHVFKGFSNPLESRPRSQLVLRGLKRLKGSPPRLRCPIAPSLLLLFRKHLIFQDLTIRCRGLALALHGLLLFQIEIVFRYPMCRVTNYFFLTLSGCL